MAAIVKSMVETAPSQVTKGSTEKRIFSGVVYAAVMGLSVVGGVALNRYLKAQATAAKPDADPQKTGLMIDVGQMVGGAVVAGAVPNDIVRTIGLGQAVAGGIGLMDKAVTGIRTMVAPKVEGVSATIPTITGWD